MGLLVTVVGVLVLKIEPVVTCFELYTVADVVVLLDLLAEGARDTVISVTLTGTGAVVV